KRCDVRAGRGWGVRHQKRGVERLERAAGVLYFREGAAMRELRVRHGLPDRAVGRRWHAVAVEHGLNFSRRALLRPLFELVDQFAPIGAAMLVLGKTRVGDPLRMAGRGG